MPTTITPTIVNLNTTVTYASQPSQLQQSGALISLGGTTLTTNTYSYCGSLNAFDQIVSATGNYVELTNQATSFFAQGNAVGLYVLELGTETTAGENIPNLQTWITDQPSSFYAYATPSTWDSVTGAVQTITVTKTGSGYTSAPTVTIAAPSSGTTATATAVLSNGGISSVVITNPGTGYTTAPVVTIGAPPSGGVQATATAAVGNPLAAIAGNYSSPNAKTYFFITTTVSDLPNYGTSKSVFAAVPSPNAGATESAIGGMLYNWLVNNPSAAAPLAPMSYRYLYGLTPWPQSGQSSSVQTILTDYGNLVWTGAEGGITNAALYRGTVKSGAQASAWFGVDWFQIQVKQALAAAILNGSNSTPPLLYNQHGINTLLAVAQSVGSSAVAFGCAQSVVVTATPFQTYITQNPNDYANGIYNGLSATITAQNGFLTITFNLDAVQLA